MRQVRKWRREKPFLTINSARCFRSNNPYADVKYVQLVSDIRCPNDFTFSASIKRVH